MSELEAELRLLNAGDAVPCIRYARDRDGLVIHLAPSPPRRLHVASASARALVVASALMARDAVAQGKDKPNEPVQCVMLNALEPAPAAGRARQGQRRPHRPRHPRRRRRRFSSPAHRRRRNIRSPTGRSSFAARSRVTSSSRASSCKAPLAQFRMTPGDFVVEVSEPGKKKKRKIKFTITLDQRDVDRSRQALTRLEPSARRSATVPTIRPRSGCATASSCTWACSCRRARVVQTLRRRGPRALQRARGHDVPHHPAAPLPPRLSAGRLARVPCRVCAAA